MEGQSPSEIDKQFAQAFPKYFRSHLLDLFASLSLSSYRPVSTIIIPCREYISFGKKFATYYRIDLY